MTTRPPFDEQDALGPEERTLADALRRIDAGMPSASLDARILAAARAAAGPASVRAAPAGASTAGGIDARSAPRAVQARRRWPTAVGAAATLVVAVGLAWQLKPLLDIPPPLRQRPEAAATDAEVLAHAEPVAPSAAPPPPPAMVAEGKAAAASAARPAARAMAPRAVAAQRAMAKSAPVAPVQPADATATAAHGDYLDEAVGDHADSARPPAAAPAAPAAEAQTLRYARDESATSERVEVTGSRVQGIAAGAAPAAAPPPPPAVALPPIASDASLPRAEWLQRIRERRDAGQVDEARESLRRFVRRYPRHRLPDDLRTLLAAPR